MLARARSKLALEKLVIKRGAFVDEKEVEAQSMGADELIRLLQPAEKAGDDPQSGVVDEKVTPRIVAGGWAPVCSRPQPLKRGSQRRFLIQVFGMLWMPLAGSGESEPEN